MVTVELSKRQFVTVCYSLLSKKYRPLAQNTNYDNSVLKSNNAILVLANI